GDPRSIADHPDRVALAAQIDRGDDPVRDCVDLCDERAAVAARDPGGRRSDGQPAARSGRGADVDGGLDLVRRLVEPEEGAVVRDADPDAAETLGEAVRG